MIAAALAEAPERSEERRHFRAFVRDDATRRVVDQVMGELMVPHASVHQGGVAEAIRLLGVERSPRLLIVDITGVDLPLSAINELAEVCEPGVAVIAVGERNDVGLFRELVHNGVSDYLVKPLTPALLQRSVVTVIDAAAHRRQNRLGRLIAVTGARGGVGTTMVATGVAWSIAHDRSRRVGLLDLDLQYGTVALALDLEPSRGLRDALEHASRIDSLFVERTMTRCSDTLFVLSAEEALAEPMQPDQAAMDSLIRELRNKFHYVVVDVPRQVSATTQKVLHDATDLFVVTDLSLGGMRDTLRQVTALPAANAGCQISVVGNRIGEHRQGEISRAEFETAIARKLDFAIPFDPKDVAAAMNAGRAVAAGNSKVTPVLRAIAERICGTTTNPRQKWFRLWPARR